MSGELEKELREGLVGVTPGPWYEGDGWVFVSPENADLDPSRPLRSIMRDVNEKQIRANVSHIARCHPGNIATILDALATERALRKKAERERDEDIKALHEAFAKPISILQDRAEKAERERDALREAARNIVPFLKWTISEESPGYHPTMPSAVASFLAASPLGGDK